jgi:hypothetical protein
VHGGSPIRKRRPLVLTVLCVALGILAAHAAFSAGLLITVSLFSQEGTLDFFFGLEKGFVLMVGIYCLAYCAIAAFTANSLWEGKESGPSLVKFMAVFILVISLPLNAGIVAAGFLWTFGLAHIAVSIIALVPLGSRSVQLYFRHAAEPRLSRHDG